MAYRIRLAEPIKSAVRRVGVEQMSRAARALVATSDKQVAIHSARKCIKRTRALLRLVRPALSEKTFSSENTKLRSIAVALAPARDRHVLLETVLNLEARAGPVENTGLVVVRRRLQAQDGPQAIADWAFLDQSVSALTGASRRISRLKLKGDVLDAIEQSLETSYRRARKRSRLAYERHYDEDFHEWRKDVQNHWRHMTLLSDAWPEVLLARAEAARHLSKLLGDDHDLSMLIAFCEGAAGDANDAITPVHANEVIKVARAHQLELRREADIRRVILFAEGPRAHAKQIGTLWRAADRLAKLGETVSTDELKSAS